MMRRIPERATDPQRLRRELVDGKAPILLDEANTRTLLGITARQLENMVADDTLEDMTFIGPRRYFRAAEVRGIMLTSAGKKPSMNSGTYEGADFAVSTTSEEAPREVVSPPIDAFTLEMAPIIDRLRDGGAKTLSALADALNAEGVARPNGGRWHGGSVAKIVDQLAA